MKIKHVAAAALLALAAISLPALAPAQSTVAETLARFGRFLDNDGMIGVVVDYALPDPPPGWLLCVGQALPSDTPYQALRAKLIAGGSPYGTSGGNPLLPDARGRVTAAADNMGGTAANRLTSAGGVTATAIGAVGGAQTQTLTVAQMPSHSHGVTDPGHAHIYIKPTVLVGSPSGSLNQVFGNSGTGTYTDVVGTGISIQNNGSGQAHPNVQPTLVLNKIIFAGV